MMIKNLKTENLKTEDLKKKQRYYFDFAASSPYKIEDNDINYFFGNPSSLHYEGRQAKQALEDARKSCAAVLNVPPDTLYFTSGGTESNSIALFSNMHLKDQYRITASKAEHLSVREAMQTLGKAGKKIGSIAVDTLGMVTAEIFSKAVAEYADVRFASCMAVNNETGAITGISALNEICKKQTLPVHLHCDLVQAIGKIPVDINKWEIDSASISAHKIGGPRGIGLLYLRKPLEVFYKGGGQENKIRGGTENTHGAQQMAFCLEKFANKKIVADEFIKARQRCDKFLDSLMSMERAVIIPEDRCKPENENKFSPYIIQAAFKGIPGEVMARFLDDLGFAVSTGSACSSSSVERPVLAAMGINEKLRNEGIRISQSFETTKDEINLLIEAIKEAVKFL